MTMRIAIKRAYEDAAPEDGCRILVDRLWPRGRSRQTLALAEWAKDVAPSAALIRWFGHDPARWEEFRIRYRRELESPQQRARLISLLDVAGKGPLTLVYGARDQEHNQAVVLREALQAMTRRR